MSGYSRAGVRGTTVSSQGGVLAQGATLARVDRGIAIRGEHVVVRVSAGGVSIGREDFLDSVHC
jgi:hypothetical protein